MKRTPIRRRLPLRARKPEREPCAPPDKVADDLERRAQHIKWIKSLPCHVCGRGGGSDAHHSFHDRYGARKRTDWLTLPLCRHCHLTGLQSVHKAKAAWRAAHGPDWRIAMQYLARSPVWLYARLCVVVKSIGRMAK